MKRSSSGQVSLPDHAVRVLVGVVCGCIVASAAVSFCFVVLVLGTGDVLVAWVDLGTAAKSVHVNMLFRRCVFLVKGTCVPEPAIAFRVMRATATTG